MSQQTPVVSKDDAALWLLYAEKLKALLAPEGLGKNGAVYIPPISTVGITGGPPRIAQVVQNLGIYDVADKMLDPDTPVFMPGGTTYFDQLERSVSSQSTQKRLLMRKPLVFLLIFNWYDEH